MALKTLQDAFTQELRDVLSAERQLVKALPKMVKAASHPELRAAFEHHLEETKHHVERVTKVFEELGQTARAEKCEAMAGLLEEGASIIEKDAESSVLDALLIAAAQKVEHYEIATYGTLCTWGESLGLDAAVQLLKGNMSEELAADEKLTSLSETINQAALEPAK